MTREMFSVLSPGAYTTVQDLGRYGYQSMGIPITGALDSYALRVANLLVGNPETSAALEITISGPRLEMRDTADLALAGADMEVILNGRPREGWRSFRVKRGDVLEIHQVKKGCRAYLAVTGGIDVPVVMGSRSTYVGGKLGGHRGRPLRASDLLGRGDGSVLRKDRWLPRGMIPDHPAEPMLRAVPGPQDEFFLEGAAVFFEASFMVTAKADRLGYRLQGPSIAIREGMPKSIISEPCVPGSVQIPADAQPIIVLVEHSVGGYSKIATVVTADIARVAQATPGDTFRFEKVTIETAHVLYREREESFRKIESLLLSD
jgi:biotin-dependent carboxylase-like uncharacterized protein